MMRRFFMGGQLFTAQSLALFGRMTTPPSFTRQRQIDVLIRALLAGGVWSKLDILYVLAAADSQAALLNWKGATFAPTNNGATFTADRGFTGDAVSAYLATGYGPGDGQFTDTAHTFGRWTRAAAAANNTDIGTQDASYLSVVTGGSSGFTARDGAVSDGVASALSAAADVAVVRDGGSFEAYRDGASIGTDVAAYTGPAYDFVLLAKNNLGTNESFSANEVSAAYFGDKLTAGEVSALHAALATYMTAVGA